MMHLKENFYEKKRDIRNFTGKCIWSIFFLITWAWVSVVAGFGVVSSKSWSIIGLVGAEGGILSAAILLLMMVWMAV